MCDPNSSYNTVSASQIVECVAACVKTKGLQRALEDFEGMQNILSGLQIWNQIKQEVDTIFANERMRLERLELARAKTAALPYVQPPALQQELHVSGLLP